MKFKTMAGSNPFGNQQKILWHPKQLCEFLTTGSTFPVQVELNPTNRCNMHCEWCIAAKFHKPESIPIGNLSSFMKEFAAMGGKSIDWTGGGEPTLYGRFEDAVEIANSFGLRQGLMTNGSFAEDRIESIIKNFDWVRVSLDCMNADAYSGKKGVGADVLGKVIGNIEAMCSYEKRPRIVANVNLAPWNYRHLIETIDGAKVLGCDGIQVRPVLPKIGEKYTEHDMRFFQTAANNLSDIQHRGDEKFQVFISWDKFNDILDKKIHDRSYTSCQFHNFVVALDASGDLCVCTHHIGDDRFTFGNIKEHSLAHIWESEKRAEVMEFCKDMDFEGCQCCCKLHEGNKFLDMIQHPDTESDPDFF
jgi:MoaA/NifB/PqqE/SkfB family radical SAM enzyme